MVDFACDHHYVYASSTKTTKTEQCQLCGDTSTVLKTKYEKLMAYKRSKVGGEKYV